MGALLFLVTNGCQAQAEASDPYAFFRAPNNIVIEYAVYLPEGFDERRTYPAVLAFPSGDMERADADEMTDQLWPTPDSRGDWIVVVPLVPGEDWRTHPNHHALEDLLDHVNERYAIQGDLFHLIGYGRKGSDIASTWAFMSRRYFRSFTTVGDVPYRTWNDSDLTNLVNEESGQERKLGLLAVYGVEDRQVVAEAERANERLARTAMNYQAEAIAGNRVELASLNDGGLLELMAVKHLPR